jgi:hypothetical protein
MIQLENNKDNDVSRYTQSVNFKNSAGFGISMFARIDRLTLLRPLITFLVDKFLNSGGISFSTY